MAKAMQELEAESVEAEIVWGSILPNQIIQIRKCVGNLQISIQEYFETLQGAGDNLSSDDWKKLRNDLYAVRDSRDPLSDEMRNAVQGFERAVREKMKR